MSMKAFLRQNAVAAATQECVVSPRFLNEKGQPVKWQIRPMSEDENTKLKDDCTTRNTFKGRQTSNFDSNRYTRLLCVKSVAFPDLSDAELQKSYGVVGEDDLLGAMLLPGEFATLMEYVQEVNGFDADRFNEAKAEAKNA